MVQILKCLFCPCRLADEEKRSGAGRLFFPPFRSFVFSVPESKKTESGLPFGVGLKRELMGVWL